MIPYKYRMQGVFFWMQQQPLSQACQLLHFCCRYTRAPPHCSAQAGNFDFSKLCSNSFRHPSRKKLIFTLHKKALQKILAQKNCNTDTMLAIRVSSKGGGGGGAGEASSPQQLMKSRVYVLSN